MRLVTYNVAFGRRESLDQLTAVLAPLAADIVTLNEADHEDVVADLADRLGMGHVWARGSGDHHVATLSRHPIVQWQCHTTPPLTQAVLQTTLMIAERPLTVYNLHFLPFMLLPYEVRRWQSIGRLLQLIAEEPPGAHLLVGDFNAIAPGDPVAQRRNPLRPPRNMLLQLRIIFRFAIPRLLKAGYVDCFRRINPHADGYTYVPGGIKTRYDYVFAPPQVASRLRDCFIVSEGAAKTASDHYPLVADFDWPEAAVAAASKAGSAATSGPSRSS